MNSLYVVFNGSFCCPDVVFVNPFSVLTLLMALALMFGLYVLCEYHVFVECKAKNGWMFI